MIARAERQEHAQVLEQRKNADPAKSYVASLHQEGLNKILEKVGEESIETILAARDCVENGNGIRAPERSEAQSKPGTGESV